MALQESNTRKRSKRVVQIRLMHDASKETPLQPDTLRPFRLYNAMANVFIVHRYYSSQRRAEWGVLKELKWLPVGTVIDVVDVRYGHLLCTYKHVMENGQHGIRYEDF